MADLKKFIYPGLRSGTPVNLYLNKFPQIGDGAVVSIDSLYISLKVKGEMFGKPFDDLVEITMRDLAPRGVCRFMVKSQFDEESEYGEEAGRLNIKKHSVQIYTEGKWTWVWGTYGLVAAWIGIWPKGEEMTENDKAMLSQR